MNRLRLDGGGLRRQFVLGGVRLKILKLHLELIEQPCLALRAGAKELAPELLDLQLQPRNHRIRAGVNRGRASGKRLSLDARGALRQDHRMGGGKVGGERFSGRHTAMESHPPPGASKKHQPDAVGLQVFCGMRQSIPSSR